MLGNIIKSKFSFNHSIRFAIIDYRNKFNYLSNSNFFYLTFRINFKCFKN